MLLAQGQRSNMIKVRLKKTQDKKQKKAYGSKTPASYDSVSLAVYKVEEQRETA